VAKVLIPGGRWGWSISEKSEVFQALKLARPSDPPLGGTSQQVGIKEEVGTHAGAPSWNPFSAEINVGRTYC